MSSAPELIDKQLRKLRRRIEEFLRTTTPTMLFKIAKICKIHVPETLRDYYKESEKDT